MSVTFRNGIALLLVLISFSLCRSSSVQSTADTPAKQVDALLSEWDTPDSPGVAVVVVWDGTVVYKRGVGCADLEHGVMIDTSSVFEVASVSKHVTAFAILMLAEMGELSLDDDVRKYVPDLPDYGHRLTLRHLIHQMSGLRDYWELLDVAGFDPRGVVSQSEAFDIVVSQEKLNFEPGQRIQYSNTNYLLLAEIVGSVTGQSFREWTSENIFEPLGMNRTFFLDDHKFVIPGRARGYRTKAGFRGQHLESGYLEVGDRWEVVGATNLFTTADDLGKWMENFFEPKVGSNAVTRQMLETGTLADGETVYYGGGLFLFEKHQGMTLARHFGSEPGYGAHIAMIPEKRFGVAVLTNLVGLNFNGLGSNIIDIYHGVRDSLPAEHEEMPKDTAIELDAGFLEKFAGIYVIESSMTTFSITRDGDRLFGKYKRNPGFELVAESDTTFVSRPPGWRITVERDPTDQVSRLLLSIQAGGWSAQAFKVRAQPAAELEEYAGFYFSTEVKAEYEILVQDGGLVMRHRWDEPIQLVPTGEDEFTAELYWVGAVRFTRDESGVIDGFLYDGGQGRLKDLRFQKREDCPNRLASSAS